MPRKMSPRETRGRHTLAQHACQTPVAFGPQQKSQYNQPANFATPWPEVSAAAEGFFPQAQDGGLTTHGAYNQSQYFSTTAQCTPDNQLSHNASYPSQGGQRYGERGGIYLHPSHDTWLQRQQVHSSLKNSAIPQQNMWSQPRHDSFPAHRHRQSPSSLQEIPRILYGSQDQSVHRPPASFPQVQSYQPEARRAADEQHTSLQGGAIYDMSVPAIEIQEESSEIGTLAPHDVQQEEFFSTEVVQLFANLPESEELGNLLIANIQANEKAKSPADGEPLRTVETNIEQTSDTSEVPGSSGRKRKSSAESDSSTPSKKARRGLVVAEREVQAPAIGPEEIARLRHINELASKVRAEGPRLRRGSERLSSPV